MKKINKLSLLSFTSLLILVVMGIAVWDYFLGDGSLPSMNFMFFSLIFFGVILLLIVLNLDKFVKLSNPESKGENIPALKEEDKTIEEIVSAPIAEDELQVELTPMPLTEEKEEGIVPTPTAEEKPKVEIKNGSIEKPAPSVNLKPFGSHSGNKRSGVWIDEK